MTEKFDSSTCSPGRQSFTAAPTDQARTYQAGGDQTITEHHHHTPRGSLKAGMVWSLAGMTTLALGTFVGVDMWQRHPASTAAPAGDAKAPISSASFTPSTSPILSATPSGTASSSPRPGKAVAQQGPAAASPDPTPSTSASTPAPNPATYCTEWNDAGFSHVQVKACGRNWNGSLYMNAEWRTTAGSELLDVYLWLENATGTKVAYPGTSLPNGMPYHQMAAWPKPRTYPQWKEAEVGKDLLAHSEKYQVCVAVRKKNGTAPAIFSPPVQAFRIGIVYT
ncbi:hypothetical protein [Streptomyces fagopyri]|uniref:hypothetical protein n=1 Tax=Streptomyces fagopyri TaxID=2662397 RepID=UPI0038224329